MNIVECKTKDLILLSSGESTNLSNLTNSDSILAWNGKSSFVGSSILKVDIRMSESTYLIKTNSIEVELSDSQGFWLDGGVELKANHVKSGDNIYVKSGDDIILEEVKSVDKIAESRLVYNIVGSQYHNYILDGALLHNVDIEDYLNLKIIGCGNEELPQGAEFWGDLWQTARASRDAFIKAFNENLISASAWTLRSDLTTEVAAWQSAIDTSWDKYEIYYAKMNIYFNSLMDENAPEKETGIVTYPNAKYVTTMTSVEETDIGVFFSYPVTTTVDINVDYTGKGTFDISYFNEFETAMNEWLASLKVVFNVTQGWELGEYDYPSTPPINGYVEIPDPYAIP